MSRAPKPETFVALLRGVNVGRNKIRMADLRALVENLGFTQVRTLLNSGNVLFTASPAAAARAAADIAARLVPLQVKSRVFVLPLATVREIRDADPFRGVATDHSRYLVALFPENIVPPRVAALAVQDWGVDRFAIVGPAAYLWCAAGVLESPLAKAFGRAAGDATTTRNWATIQKLAV